MEHVDNLGRATRLQLFRWDLPQTRAFHITWISFFLCFFGWFGIAPLMPVVRADLGLSKTQIGNIVIASVFITVFVRLLVGPLCDKYGPRKTYSALLLLGSLPVMGIGLATNYEQFLLFRLAIGAIGASFIITQYHTSVMYAPNVVGLANATAAGWGNLGGGVTQAVMPMVLALIVSLGVEQTVGWRLAMVVPGLAMLLMSFVYWKYTQDAPRGNYSEPGVKLDVPGKKTTAAGFQEAMRDVRVWALFVIYAACFGVEIAFENVVVMYYFDNFALDLKTAGLIAAMFGGMSLFARSLGGWLSDRWARKGLQSRVTLLFWVILGQGIAMTVFSRMDVLGLAVLMMVVFSAFMKMAEGATYGVVPFVNRRALGAVAGIVGAGGNVGAVMAGFLFRSESVTTQDALLYMGLAVIASSGAVWLVRLQAAEPVAATVIPIAAGVNHGA